MWWFLLLCGIISEQIWDITAEDVCSIDLKPAVKLTGCPTTIPITEKGEILAGRIWDQPRGYHIPELSCNGDCSDCFANTKYPGKLPLEKNGTFINIASFVINPGCILYVYKEFNFRGDEQKFDGPITEIIDIKKLGKAFDKCGKKKDVPCVGSMLWSCKQIYPSCIFTDKWQTIVQLDNSDSDLPTTFTYVKSVGTTFSHEMTESKSVSTGVSASITAAFWDLGFKFGVSKDTKYDWKEVDTEVKTKTETYTVQVTVSAKKNIKIQEVVGICGENTIHTQTFRVMDDILEKTLYRYNGKMTDYKISDSKPSKPSKGKGKGKGKGRK